MRQKLGLALATAVLWIGFGVGGRAEAAGIALQTPAGLSPGDSFRFVFVTDGSTTGTSSNIADYNSFVNTQAGGATYNGTVITWDAIASTPTVNAIDNVVQTPEPVYLADGTKVTTNTTSTGLWSGSLLHPINEDLNATITVSTVFTGTNTDGLGFPGFTLGNTPLPPQTSLLAEVGSSIRSDLGWVASGFSGQSGPFSLFGISQELVVSPSAVPEPSSLWMAGIALSAGLAYGWSRHRRDQRLQRPVGPPNATQ